MQKSILIVDDDKDILAMLKYNLEKEGYKTLTATDGESAMELAQTLPDLILLDVLIPGFNGWEVARRLKREKRTSNIPFFFITAKDSEVDEIVGLELGAIDFLKKPISIGIFLARVRSILRIRENFNDRDTVPQELILPNGMEIDPGSYSVRIHGKEVLFAKREFELLSYMGHHPGAVLSREVLLSAVWGKGTSVFGRTVDVHIRKIREKLGEYARHIVSVKKVGYKFSTDRR